MVVDVPAQDAFCASVNATAAGSCELIVFPDDFHSIFNELDRGLAFRIAYDFLESYLE